MESFFDIVVVGGGHAGCEAAAAAARLGSRVLLITMDLNRMAQMSCNPAIGGIGKGQIVREIDALGGLTGVITDLTTIHFRMLNRSKGPAMWSPRAQCDKLRFSMQWRNMLATFPTLSLLHDTVVSIDTVGCVVSGVRTKNGFSIRTRAVVLTAGTFLNGCIHIGSVSYNGGRIGEESSTDLSAQLLSFGFSMGRMKTGTPVRLDARSINLDKLAKQHPEIGGGKFSFDQRVTTSLPQHCCYILRTNPDVHNILREGFSQSPLFTGQIKGVGPRYCPSIETKIDTFTDKDSHQLFLEPEGIDTNEMYLNGFSSSLPLQVQIDALHRVEGLEQAFVMRPGYAIEYDYFDPTQLKHTLETKLVHNLFFAGQINGTTGYEEAAGQGLMAGINAHRSINGLDSFVLGRDQGYIGVLIDDLVIRGVDEPYRVFTSRAEYRTLIRQDNADERLSPLAHAIGMIDDERFALVNDKHSRIKSYMLQIKSTDILPSEINATLELIGSSPINQKRSLQDILLRPEITLATLRYFVPVFDLPNTSFYSAEDITQSAELRIKYEHYIEKEQQTAEKYRQLEHIRIADSFNFNQLESLSTEARQKLTRIAPKTIGEAKRIPGISPNDINVLLIYFGR